MKKQYKLNKVAIAIAFVCSGISAEAALISSICEINGINVCGQASAPEIPQSGVLTIRGYAFDMATNDRPNEQAGGYIVGNL